MATASDPNGSNTVLKVRVDGSLALSNFIDDGESLSTGFMEHYPARVVSDFVADRATPDNEVGS